MLSKKELKMIRDAEKWIDSFSDEAFHDLYQSVESDCGPTVDELFAQVNSLEEMDERRRDLNNRR